MRQSLWHGMARHRCRLMKYTWRSMSMKLLSQYMHCSATILLRLGVSSCFQKSRSSVTAQSCHHTISFHSPRTMSPPPLSFTTRDLRSLRFSSCLFHRTSRLHHDSATLPPRCGLSAGISFRSQHQVGTPIAFSRHLPAFRIPRAL